MDDTCRDDEVTKAKSAIKEALGMISGDGEIRAGDAAGEPHTEAKADDDLAKQPASCPSGR